MRDHIGQIGAGQNVGEKNHGEYRHRQADRTPRRLEQQQNADRRRRRRQTGSAHRAASQARCRTSKGSRRQMRRRTRRSSRAPAHVVARRSLARGKRKEREKQPGRQMNRARLSVVEYTEAQRERQRRCIPELEEHPRQSDAKHDLAVNADGGASAEIGVDDELFDLIELAQLHFSSRLRRRLPVSSSRSLPQKQRRAVLAARLATARAGRSRLLDPAFFFVVAHRAVVQRR